MAHEPRTIPNPMALTHPSPNYGDRRGDARISLVVLHYTAMTTAAEALERLREPETEVSAHYLIAEDGTLASLVAEDKRAWHAGAGRWGAVGDVNSASIGIELANDARSPFPEPQMSALERLLGDVMARHALAPQAVIAHSDLAPGRKRDPGRLFDWRRLAQAGLSVWPSAGPDADPGGFLRDARAFGYTADAPPDDILTAFRLRFRPDADGPVDATDAAMAADLARRFPVDAGPPTS